MNRLLILFFLGLLILPNSSVNAAETVWGPGEGYIVEFIHSVRIDINNTMVLNKRKLPVTNFHIIKLAGTGYSYNYQGYGDRSFSGQVSLENIKAFNQEIDVPIGALPVILPVVYKGVDNWISFFASTLRVLVVGNITNHLSIYFKGDFSSDGDQLIFSTNQTIGKPEIAEVTTSPYSIPSPIHPSIDGSYNTARLVSELIYNKKTGIIFKFEQSLFIPELINKNTGEINSALISQTIDFVTIVPPHLILANITKIGSSLILTIALLYFSIRKRRIIH